jgi:entericidin B
MFRVIFALLAVVGSMAVSACNTVEGAGEDVQKGGQVISDTAEETKKKL